MIVAAFVGRDSEMRQITSAVTRKAATPAVVVVEGAPGAGKSALVVESLRRLAATAGPKTLAVFGHCYEESGQRDAFHPITEMVETLEGVSSKKHGAVGVAALAFKRTAPDWLEAIPLVGPFFSAGAKTLTTGWDVMTESRNAHDRQGGLAKRYASAIADAARTRDRLILVFEDAHWIDAASCDLVLRLATDRLLARVALVFACRPAALGHNDAFVKLRTQLVSHASVETVVVGSLSESEIAAYLNQRFGTSFFTELPRWLIHLCDGHALFVVQYLNLLEEEGIIVGSNGVFSIDGNAGVAADEWHVNGRLATLPISRDVATLLDQRIARLEDEEREMLQLAAVQGHHFGSLVLARVFERKEPNVMAQLRRVSERHRVIRLFGGGSWLRERSEIYAFEHVLMQQALYRKLGPHERTLLHRGIADVLEPLVAEYSQPPRALLLDVARHRRNAREAVAAARHYYAAAMSSYLDGATVETVQLCEEVRECLVGVVVDDARDRLTAESVLLQLTCTLHGAIGMDANRRLIELAAEGESAAMRIDDIVIRSEIQALRGQLYIRAGNVPEAIAVMRSAVAAARDANDPVATFFSLCQLGKQLAKQDLVESLAIRYEAQSFYDAEIGQTALTPEAHAIIVRQAASLTVYIGVGELDRGNLERAVNTLEGAIRDLERLHMYDDLVAASNYLAQAYWGIGRYEDAENVLRRSLVDDSHRGQAAENPWRGYNLGLLAKLELDQGRPEEAGSTMLEAVRISETMHQADLLTLVRNYQAELLMQKGSGAANAHAAEQVLLINLAESRDGGFHRSAAMSCSLLGLLHCARGDLTAAHEFASEAITYVEKHGDMPALRTEEVYYNHYAVVSRKPGQQSVARASLEKAMAVVRRKRDSLTMPVNRDAFDRIPLCCDIRDALLHMPPEDTAVDAS